MPKVRIAALDSDRFVHVLTQEFDHFGPLLHRQIHPRVGAPPIGAHRDQIATREQLDLANRFKQVYSTYQQNRDLITVGAYRRGADPRVDLAVEQWPKMMEFLRQDMYEPVGTERSYADLRQLVTQFSAPVPAVGR